MPPEARFPTVAHRQCRVRDHHCAACNGSFQPGSASSGNSLDTTLGPLWHARVSRRAERILFCGFHDGGDDRREEVLDFLALEEVDEGCWARLARLGRMASEGALGDGGAQCFLFFGAEREEIGADALELEFEPAVRTFHVCMLVA